MKKDTISALATPVGGAICVIRLSGPDAISIADSVFSRNIADAKANTLHYGEIMDDDRCVVDDAIIAVYRAPHSYTGEDSIEISCHGSAYIVQQILILLEAHGARQAEPQVNILGEHILMGKWTCRRLRLSLTLSLLRIRRSTIWL